AYTPINLQNNQEPLSSAKGKPCPPLSRSQPNPERTALILTLPNPYPYAKPAGHVPRLGEQSLRRPPLRAAGGSVCGTGRSSSGGTSRRRLCGGFLSLGPRVHRRHGRRAVGGDRVRRSAAATLDACRALLADHLSYGDRWGNPLFARGTLR
ncbi:unnamed protein product, partial [Pleuronectes platessa]